MMKKIHCLILAMISLCFVPYTAACSTTCEHQLAQKKQYYCLKDGEDGKEIYTLDKCTLCDQQVKVKGQVVGGQSEVAPALHNAEKGDVIYLKKSRYILINVLRELEDVTFYAEDNTSVDEVKLAPDGQIKNITFRNIDFITSTGGLTMMSDIDGINVIDCAFEGGVQFADSASGSPEIKNVNIQNTSFTKIANGHKLTAVRIKKVENFTMTNCTFDEVEYNAIQIGGTKLTGRVTIKGNSFRETVSRVIHLANNEITSCDISDNTFYSNMDFEEASGRYVHGYNGNIVLGMNRWEIIPEAIDDNFSGISVGNVTYDKTQQILIEE